METKSLYTIGPRGGLTKAGECPVNCDAATVLGQGHGHEWGKTFVWGKGRTESQRRQYARFIGS